MLLKIIFEYYAYLCFILFFFGSIYKVIFSILNNQNFLKQKNDFSQYINIGILNLVFLHFAGYFISRELFLLIGLSASLQTKLAHMVSGIIVSLFLTYIVIVICKKYFKQKLSFNGSLSEKILYTIIILHILLGFVSILAITGLEDKVLRNLALKNYFSELFSFKQTAYLTLKQLKLITLGHLFLGFSLIAILPFTNIIETLIAKIKINNFKIINSLKTRKQ